MWDDFALVMPGDIAFITMANCVNMFGNSKKSKIGFVREQNTIE